MHSTLLQLLYQGAKPQRPCIQQGHVVCIGSLSGQNTIPVQSFCEAELYAIVQLQKHIVLYLWLLMSMLEHEGEVIKLSHEKYCRDKLSTMSPHNLACILVVTGVPTKMHQQILVLLFLVCVLIIRIVRHGCVVFMSYAKHQHPYIVVLQKKPTCKFNDTKGTSSNQCTLCLKRNF